MSPTAFLVKRPSSHGASKACDVGLPAAREIHGFRSATIPHDGLTMMATATCVVLVGSSPATPVPATLRSIRSLAPRYHRQLRGHGPQPRVLSDSLSQTKLSLFCAPTLSTFRPRPNPHSARGTASALPLAALSCIGAFQPPAASARGRFCDCRRLKTYT